MGDRKTNRALKNYALWAWCWNKMYYGYFSSASYAVDRKPDYCGYSKSSTTMLQWCQVDLGKPILVSQIIIISKDKKLENFDVDLGLHTSTGRIYYPCFHFSGKAGVKTTLNCTQSIWGQWVRVSMTGQSLVLCEVEVYGDADATTPGSLSHETHPLPSNLAA
ncbi:hypothetical protein C0Q70_10044 [Pomacea canaliculata]|uniref:Fucolectin tachylectin-4 pentraxin-1 domain-containing protein n=1 Tax=Pomacea canaliculata TaxID=400727 RepID=A0A2T7PBI3_POMCA|nr:hypothetical protein C0Q70_10044 [Pomacea canaliculata]